MKWLVLAIALYREQLEANRDLAPSCVLVTRREVAVDSAPDLLALCVHANRFGNDQVTVTAYLDVTVKRLDVLCRGGGHRKKHQRKGR